MCGVAIIKRKAAHLPFWGAASEWDRHAAHRHGWPAAKCSSERRTCLLGRCIRKGQARRASSRLACGQMFLRAAHLPFGALHKNGAGTPRIVTVGLRPNIPQSSAPAFLGRCIRIGQACRVSSRLAYGQMFLRAAHLLFGALYKKRTGTPRIVTVGLRPNIPQSGAPAFWGAASE